MSSDVEYLQLLLHVLPAIVGRISFMSSFFLTVKLNLAFHLSEFVVKIFNPGY